MAAESHQERLYFLLDQLQRMARELPTKYQQRIPYDLLAELAASLVQCQIFEIVNMLTEVQQATEKHLFQQRLQSINRQKVEKQDMIIKNLPHHKIVAADARFKE